MLTWPLHVKYVTWSLEGSMLRVYIEYRTSVYVPKRLMAALGGAELCSDEFGNRIERRAFIQNTVGEWWEHGQWEHGKPGRPRTRDALEAPEEHVHGAPEAHTGGSRQQRVDDEVNTQTVVSVAEYNAMKEQLNSMKEQMDAMCRCFEELKAQPSQTNNTINIVTINTFGKEDVSFLDDETLLKRLMAKSAGVVQTIKDVHMNDARPENCNVRMQSKRNHMAQKYVDGQWTSSHVSQLVDDLIFNGFKINSVGYRNADVTEHSHGLVEWMNDIMSIKTMRDTKKKHVVRARQAVRTMLMGRPL